MARKKSYPRYIIDKNGCWIWQLKPSPNGYGRVTIECKTYYAHRYYYEKYKGKISDSLQLDHLCRVRNCVNPAHLEPVSCAVNIRRGKNAKLKLSTVRKIRRLYEAREHMQKDIATIFNVSRTQVSRIVNYRRWK